MQDLDINALKHTFDEDGFVVLRGYLAPSDLEDFKSRTLRLVERAPSDAAANGKYAAVRKNLQKHDPWAFDYLHHGPQVPLIEALVEDALVPATFGSFDKRPGKEDRIDPHFDAVGGPAHRVGATMWIALDPVSHQSGCLYYLRRSHKRHFESKVGLDISAYKADAVAMEAAPGDAFIHDARTVHWSGQNQTGAPRRAAVMFYWGKVAAQASEAAVRRKQQGAKK